MGGQGPRAQGGTNAGGVDEKKEKSRQMMETTNFTQVNQEQLRWTSGHQALRGAEPVSKVTAGLCQFPIPPPFSPAKADRANSPGTLRGPIKGGMQALPLQQLFLFCFKF